MLPGLMLPGLPLTAIDIALGTTSRTQVKL